MMCRSLCMTGAPIRKLRSAQTICSFFTSYLLSMTLDEYRAEVNRICTNLARVPRGKRIETLQTELARLPEEYREAALALVATTIDLTADHAGMKTWEKITMIAAGFVFLLLLLSIALLVPEPTDFQIFVFRIVLAIAASAFAS